jgi:hypothetical protein
MSSAVLPRPTGHEPVFVRPAGLPRVGSVRFVDVPDRRCLAIDGQSAPGGLEFQAAVGSLYTTVYSLHFLLRDRGIEAPVGHLEGLWEQAGGSTTWRWTLAIELPEEATEEDVASALAVARRKRPAPELDRLRLMTLAEGRAVEAMHVGPYATEPETIARMHAAVEAAGLRPSGPHHEVYLGDPRRSDPEHLRTLLRQPVR